MAAGRRFSPSSEEPFFSRKHTRVHLLKPRHDPGHNEVPYSLQKILPKPSNNA